MSKHTIAIFERILENLPPLVPDIVRNEMEHAMKHLQEDYSVTASEVEDIMIVFGKKIWAYVKAFEEFMDFYEGTLGDKFLLGKLPPDIKARYKTFKEHGGSYRDLYCGAPASFFTPEERQKISAALVEVNNDIRKHAEQAVLSTDRKKYEELIIDFQTILDDIEKRLGGMKQTADDEQEHPQLADEIRAQVRAFEYGLCFLGPHTRHEAVCQAPEYFVERKITKMLGK